MKRVRPQPPAGPATTPASRLYVLSLCGLVAVIAIVVFAMPEGRLLTAPDSETIRQFISWRSFAAESLRRGDVPLWNPYTYSGEPFAGGFQSALFYPPNLLFLVLPIARAINLSFLLHLLWLGWGTERLARHRGVHPIAAALAGLVLTLGGAVLPRLYAGHLSNVCTMAWTPWVLLGFSQWSRDARARGVLLAAASVAMQVFSGHVQYAFYTGVTVLLYALAVAIAGVVTWRRAFAAIAVIYAAGAMLSAVQLLPGWAAAGEGLRQNRLDFQYLQMFSLPPENLITLVAPQFFGTLSLDGVRAYWGRWYPWEMNMFTGAGGLFLAVLACWDRATRRMARIDLAVAFVLVVLALGGNTPLLQFLADYVPGFQSFRGLSKFSFPAMLFSALAIAAGADALARGRAAGRAVTIAGLVVGASLAVAGVWLMSSPELTREWLHWMRSTGESYLPEAVGTDRAFLREAAAGAGRSLLFSGFTLAGVAMCVRLSGRWSRLRWIPLAGLAIEMILFAGGHLATSSVSDATPAEYRSFVASHPGDSRVLNLALPDNGFLFGRSDIWGNDPAVLKRYAEFVTSTQGGDPDHATQTLRFTGFSPALAMLRLQYALGPGDRGMHVETSPFAPLPRVLVVPEYRVVADRDTMLTELNRDSFDARAVVLLEQPPDLQPAPASGAPAGTARVLAETSDTLEIEADTAAPAILLITDTYSRDWRARSVDGTGQGRYQVLPADYTLRAVPLAAGHHHLVLEYRPSLFTAGVALSGASWLLWLGLWVTRRPVSAAAPTPRVAAAR